MKITKTRLKEIIKEELDDSFSKGDYHHDYMYNDFFSYISDYDDFHRLPGKDMLGKINNFIQYITEYLEFDGSHREEG